MNKQLIICMPLMIICMLKIKELMKMLKEMVVFFVLQLIEIALLIHNYSTTLIIRTLKHFLPEFQFSVFGFRFSVLVPESGNFNSLYRATDSLKIRK